MIVYKVDDSYNNFLLLHFFMLVYPKYKKFCNLNYVILAPAKTISNNFENQ